MNRRMSVRGGKSRKIFKRTTAAVKHSNNKRPVAMRGGRRA